MHILVNYMYYLREGSGGIRRFNEFCKLWAAQPGVRVTVLAGIFDHFQRSTYAGLSAGSNTWEDDGPVRVLRVGSPETYAGGFVKRAWSQYCWGRNCVRALARIERPDIVISSSPNLWACFPMLAAKRRWGIPAVFEIRDLWPEALVQHRVAGPGNPAVRYLGHLERLACRNADHIVVVVETMRRSITQRKLKPASKITAIPNGILLEKYEQVTPDSRMRVRAKLGLEAGHFVTMFVGSITRTHGVENLLATAELLLPDGHMRFVCVGEGPERSRFEAAARQRGLHNLQFTGAIPTDAVPEYLAAADCGIVLGDAGEATAWDNETRGNFRNSFFDIAGARLPVVFNIPGFPVAEIEERAQAGHFGAQPQDLAALLRGLAADPQAAVRLGENNFREIAVRYNRRKLAQDYLDLLSNLVQTA